MSARMRARAVACRVAAAGMLLTVRLWFGRGGRNNPVLRNRVFGGALICALLHGAYIITTAGDDRR